MNNSNNEQQHNNDEHQQEWTATIMNNNSNSNNGNVISQKVISIGMPNKSLSKDGDLSPSPKQLENKSNFDSC
jgi:hypothetical protein